MLREGEPPQSFMLSASTDYKPNRTALDPLFKWIDAMKKRKHDVSKNADDQCRIPDQWKPQLVVPGTAPPQP